MTVRFVSDMVRNYSSGWYGYQLRKLNENLDRLKTYFHGKKEISGMDIINYIVYEAQYPTDFKNITTNIDSVLTLLNRYTKSGKWKYAHGVDVTNTKTSILLNMLTTPLELENMLNIIYDTLEDNYFKYYDPDMEQYRVNLKKKYNLEPPSILSEHYSIEDLDNIRKLINGLVPYGNKLEHIHRDVLKGLKEDILTPLLSIKDSI